jgi:glycosyltransferase involved in cell wall biosynthesis
LPQPDILIALATYNGARYLLEQIDSIRAQTRRDWALLVRDDGSTDGTVDLLRAQAAIDPRLTILSDTDQRLGCVPNFSRLAAAASERGAAYVMLADQDDIWFPTKIERTLSCMTALEQRLGKAHPILVHSDLEVIDHAGRRLARSFMRFQAIRHEITQPLRMLLVQNFVTGCTVMANRALLSLALPIPGEALMHDWWFALCAAGSGSIGFVADPTMAYRRHAANTVSARGFWSTLNPFVTNWSAVWEEGLRHHARGIAQARAVLARLSTTGHDAKAGVVRDYIDLYDLYGRRSGWERGRRALELGLHSQTLPRTAALYLRLLKPS